MRYLIQFAIPALIFLSVVYAVTKRRSTPSSENDNTTSIFLTILVIGAVIAVAVLFALQVNWHNL